MHTHTNDFWRGSEPGEAGNCACGVAGGTPCGAELQSSVSCSDRNLLAHSCTSGWAVGFLLLWMLRASCPFATGTRPDDDDEAIRRLYTVCLSMGGELREGALTAQDGNHRSCPPALSSAFFLQEQ